jgi:hypothetical protein
MHGCNKCSYTGPEGEAHYHIVVEKGKVTEVWYMSGSGYWDRDLEPDEWFVEYKDDPKHSGLVKKVKARSGKKTSAGKKRTAGKPASEDWFKPKLYKGSANFDEEDEDSS